MQTERCRIRHFLQRKCGRKSKIGKDDAEEHQDKEIMDCILPRFYVKIKCQSLIKNVKFSG